MLEFSLTLSFGVWEAKENRLLCMMGGFGWALGAVEALEALERARSELAEEEGWGVYMCGRDFSTPSHTS